MDDVLRTCLWSALKICYWDRAKFRRGPYGSFCHLDTEDNEILNNFCVLLWLHYFKKPLDTLSHDWEKVLYEIRDYFFKCKWFEVYDFIEFVAQKLENTAITETFIKACNKFLEKEMSAYRFVNRKIAPIVSEVEISEIEEALGTKNDPVKEHLRRSLEMLSDRKMPDYRNSIKEAISSIESLVKMVVGTERGTLGNLLNRIEIHAALKSAFKNLYGYTSDSNGIRHALLIKNQITFEEAKFMLVACSAFTNYVNGLLKDKIVETTKND